MEDSSDASSAGSRLGWALKWLQVVISSPGVHEPTQAPGWWACSHSTAQLQLQRTSVARSCGQSRGPATTRGGSGAGRSMVQHSSVRSRPGAYCRSGVHRLPAWAAATAARAHESAGVLRTPPGMGAAGAASLPRASGRRRRGVCWALPLLLWPPLRCTRLLLSGMLPPPLLSCMLTLPLELPPVWLPPPFLPRLLRCMPLPPLLVATWVQPDELASACASGVPAAAAPPCASGAMFSSWSWA